MTTEQKPKRRYAIPGAKRRGVYIEQPLWDHLRQVGGGNASEGVRRLAERDMDPDYAEDAKRFQWLLDGNGYFMEERMLCGHYPTEKEKDEARRIIDAEREMEKRDENT